jgi:hypothetical protein
MDRNIYIFGHAKDAFETAKEFTNYIARGIFEEHNSRYRYSQRRQTDVIVLSLCGTIYGHFETDPEVLEPTQHEIAQWAPAKGIYFVRKSSVYPRPVSLAKFGIEHIQFGKRLSESVFADILKYACVTVPVVKMPKR